MTTNHSARRGTRLLLGAFFLGASLAALVAVGVRVDDAPPAAARAPEPAAQPFPHPWTAVASTGTIDEASLPAFAFNATSLTFLPGTSALQIVARYNVTNTFDNNANPNQPGWTTMEMGSTAPPGTSVTARLFKADCTGARSQACVVSNAGGGGPVCLTCPPFAAGAVDFTTSLYYVEVTLARNGATVQPPTLHALRIF